MEWMGGTLSRRRSLTMTHPDIFDFYRLDDLLTDEQRLVRDSVRQWVADRWLPGVAEHFEAGTFPRELIPEMGRLGVLGPTLPEEYGGAGIDNVAYGLAMQELERGDSGLRSCASVQGGLVMYPIHTWGSEAQKEQWLPRLARGEAVGCFGLTEPDHGSDPGGMETRADPDGKGWRLRGAKMWITNGTIADVAVVWARTPEGIGGFLVEKGTPGFSAPETKRKLSLRASVTSELVFDDVLLPAEARLPGAAGLRCPLACLTQARYGIAWGAIGAAQDCLACARDHQLGRTQFGRPLASFQLQQAKFAEMLTRITAAQLICHRLGTLKDRGRMHHAQVSLAKRNNVLMALETAREARQMLGAGGISLEYPVIRHLANLESVITYEGTHDIHTLVLGQAVTGLPAYK